VRLVLDQNLSHRLAADLQSEFPGVCHVRDFGLDRSNDSATWTFAGANALTIVSKDDDFRQRSMVFGAPPKVIWLRIGNCPTRVAGQVLLAGKSKIEQFDRDRDAALLILTRDGLAFTTASSTPHPAP
jgi:predicted nuclease of predicted toxin-antitoxin system